MYFFACAASIFEVHIDFSLLIVLLLHVCNIYSEFFSFWDHWLWMGHIQSTWIDQFWSLWGIKLKIPYCVILTSSNHREWFSTETILVNCLDNIPLFAKCTKKGGKKCDLWNIQDLLIFIVMGFVGGLLGAWFNALNKDLTKHRILHVNSRSKFIR